MQYLKDKPASMPEAWMFLTGVNEFRRLDAWPPKNLQPTTLYFDADGSDCRGRSRPGSRSSTNTSATRTGRCRTSATPHRG